MVISVLCKSTETILLLKVEIKHFSLSNEMFNSYAVKCILVYYCTLVYWPPVIFHPATRCQWTFFQFPDPPAHLFFVSISLICSPVFIPDFSPNQLPDSLLMSCRTCPSLHQPPCESALRSSLPVLLPTAMTN